MRAAAIVPRALVTPFLDSFSARLRAQAAIEGPALNHEVVDDAVKHGADVVTVVDVAQKVGGLCRCPCVVYANKNASEVRAHRNIRRECTGACREQ